MFCATPFFLKVQAHCGKVSPTVQMQYPAPGMSIQNACYADYQSCFVDTFYAEKLRLELIKNYSNSKYAMIAYVDSVYNFLTFDSTFYHGALYYIDTVQSESVWISFVDSLKERFPVTKKSYKDNWNVVAGNPFATTYTPMIDTPFVAMFTVYDSIRDLGIGPMDGCYFEPSTYSIVGNAVHKKGLVGDRMPGVSVPWADFLLGIGHSSMAAPPVRVGHTRILNPLGAHRSTLLTPGPYRYDLRGRRFPQVQINKTSPWSWSFPVSIK